MQKHLSKAFILVMRSMWPGIYGNAGGSAVVVSNMRKRAVQASRFMLQMMQAPLYAKPTENGGENCSTQPTETVDGSLQPSFECSDEGLGFTWFLGYLFLVRHLYFVMEKGKLLYLDTRTRRSLAPLMTIENSRTLRKHKAKAFFK